MRIEDCCPSVKTRPSQAWESRKRNNVRLGSYTTLIQSEIASPKENKSHCSVLEEQDKGLSKTSTSNNVSWSEYTLHHKPLYITVT
jgi:hypothetical protein